jgi:hypothetical protein
MKKIDERGGAKKNKNKIIKGKEIRGKNKRRPSVVIFYMEV